MNERRLRQEVLRYLGFASRPADRQTDRLVDVCLTQAIDASAMKYTYAISDLERCAGGVKTCGQAFFSLDLQRHLEGCSRAVLFAATLGAGFDRLMLKYESLDMARAVILQACGAALIEQYCDDCMEEIVRQEKICGLTSRFSPGYGDFPLSAQQPLLQALSAQKQIGLSLTEAYMLTPAKSVTAVIGVGQTAGAAKSGCSACPKTDCPFRKD